MKANNGTGNNEARDLWQTPTKLYSVLHNQYGCEFDCCATFENAKTSWFSDDFEDMRSVKQMAWMNPPFSKAGEMPR